MGRAVPGHRVAVISPEGEELPDGEQGLIAVARPDPVMMLEYWRQPEATAQKFVGDWLVTGDTGARDEVGHFWFQGRDDDIISSGSYRIGPGEHDQLLQAEVQREDITQPRAGLVKQREWIAAQVGDRYARNAVCWRR